VTDKAQSRVIVGIAGDVMSRYSCGTAILRVSPIRKKPDKYTHTHTQTLGTYLGVQ